MYWSLFFLSFTWYKSPRPPSSPRPRDQSEPRYSFTSHCRVNFRNPSPIHTYVHRNFNLNDFLKMFYSTFDFLFYLNNIICCTTWLNCQVATHFPFLCVFILHLYYHKTPPLMLGLLFFFFLQATDTYRTISLMITVRFPTFLHVCDVNVYNF